MERILLKEFILLIRQRLNLFGQVSVELPERCEATDSKDIPVSVERDDRL